MRPSRARQSISIAGPTVPGDHVRLAVEHPLPLDCGVELGPVTIAYRTYGALDAARANAILVCHALSGDQFAAGAIRSPAGRAGGTA